jgi:endoglucanase Acf2
MPRCSRLPWVFLLALIGAIAGSLMPRLTPPVAAAPIPVGAGSYSTDLPPAGAGLPWCSGNYSCVPPSNVNKVAVSPKKTANVPSGAFPTNKWWTSLAYDYIANPTVGSQYGQWMHPRPLSVLATSGGISLRGMPPVYSVTSYTNPSCGSPNTNVPAYLQEYHYNYVLSCTQTFSQTSDLSIGLSNASGGALFNPPNAQVDGYSDFAVTAYQADGTYTLRSTFGRGFPFIYFDTSANAAGAYVRVVMNSNPYPGTCGTVMYFPACTSASNVGCDALGNGGQLNSNVVGLIAYDTSTTPTKAIPYALFGPTGSTWTCSFGNTLLNSAAGTSYFSVAIMPDTTSATLQTYQTYAYAFPTTTTAAPTYVPQTQQVTTSFSVTAVAKEGTNTNVLMALFPHQWTYAQAGVPSTSYTYATPRGQMKVTAGNNFQTTMTFRGVLPTLPSVAGSFETMQTYQYVNASWQAMKAYNFVNQSDAYFVGKQLGVIAELLRLAALVGHTQAQADFLAALKTWLQDWFTASSGDTHNYFYYNSTWGTLNAFPANASFGADYQVNDHHFTYGYYVQAAAAVAQFDPTWATNSQWGGMVKLVAKDAANWDRTDNRFPFMRTFDAYSGQFWASGHCNFAAGCDQESSSEAMNLATAMILFASALPASDPDAAPMLAAAVWMYTHQAETILQYLMNVDGIGGVPPEWQNGTGQFSGIPHPHPGVLWEDGAAYTSFFNAGQYQYPIRSTIQGINYQPITGGSLYLGYRAGTPTDWIPTATSAIFGDSNLDCTKDDWCDIAWEVLALSNGSAALTRFTAFAASPPAVTYTRQNGETPAHTYHWIQNLVTLGTVDPTFTANIPTFAVFKTAAGVRTFVAYNATSTASTTIVITNGAGVSCAFPSVGAQQLVALQASQCSSTSPNPDANGDGTVNAVDSLCILRLVAGLPPTAACPSTLPMADVNRDGAISAVDSLCVLRYIAGLPATPNCPLTPPSGGSSVAPSPSPTPRAAVPPRM